jgi:hypothetical protein
MTATASLDPTTAMDVLRQLRDQLGEVDAEVRAIVAVRVTGPGAVELADVTLREDRVLEVPDDAGGLVVVTGEEVTTSAADDAGEAPVAVQQLVCVLRGGDEVGLASVRGSGEVQPWSTADDPDGLADGLRPRDATSNTARRAFGLPSVVVLPSVTDVAARDWLLALGTVALERFDGPDGLEDVAVDDVHHLADRAPFGGRDGADGGWAGELPGWEELHASAAAGDLELGPFGVDPAHAGWLDAAGFAQLLDLTLPSVDELLGTLRVTGGDDLLGWAIGVLSARGWLDAG